MNDGQGRFGGDMDRNEVEMDLNKFMAMIQEISELKDKIREKDNFISQYEKIMLELDKEIISIPYPMKTAQWDTLMIENKGGFISEPEQCEHHMLQYPLLIKDDNQDIKIDKGSY